MLSESRSFWDEPTLSDYQPERGKGWRTGSFIEAKWSNFLAILLQSMFISCPDDQSGCYFSCAKKSKAKKNKKKDLF